MPENRNDNIASVKVALTEFKRGKLAELTKEISSAKSKTSALISMIKSKCDDLNLQIQREAEEKIGAEVKAPIKAEPKKQPPVSSRAAENAPEPKPEETKVEAKKVEEKKEEPKVQIIKTDNPNEQIIISPDGTRRRVYIPPSERPKAVKEKRPEYQRPRDTKFAGQQFQRPKDGAPRRPQGGMSQNKPYQAPEIAFPPNKNTKGKGGKPVNSKRPQKDDKTMSKRALINRGFIVDDRIDYDEDGEIIVRNYKAGGKKKDSEQNKSAAVNYAVVSIDPIPIRTLAEVFNKTPMEIIGLLFNDLNIQKTMNDSLDFETAELVAGEFGIQLEFKPEEEKKDEYTLKLEEQDVDNEANLVTRPPIITIMGHVDHGKTSLLDYIRKTQVTKGEAGGITQHIGAYTISLNGSPITFLDTPGHEAFTSMRARGAQVTDIAVLVVAADDGIMPQTIEAIHHAKQAKVPIIVAVNKIDKKGANPERVLQQLTEHDITPEDWGGDTPVVNVSAKTGEGVTDLLEQILTRAEVEELRADPKRKARGAIIEAKLDKGLGKIATILVQTGTLRVGDVVIAGTATGKIRAMIDDKGKRVKEAGPSVPVSVTGWNEVPEAGDRLNVVDDERFAKQLSDERKRKIETGSDVGSGLSLDDLFEKIEKGELKSVKLIIKADVQGSVEAVADSLRKLGNSEVGIDIIHSAVGAVNESDVLLAETSGAIIIGFNVRPDSNAKALAAQKKVDIRFYNIIYNAIDDIEKAVKGLLAPKMEEALLGSAEVRQIYKFKSIGIVAGCYVTSGKILRNAKARLLRDNAVVYTGEIGSLRHEKDDVKEMARGFECGVTLKNFQDIKEGDIIEAYEVKEVNEN